MKAAVSGRPKPAKKSRDLEKSRKEILGVAFREVYEHGFQGVSVQDIVKKTSMTNGAFYHHFPTKLDLGYALVDEVIKGMIIDRWIKPLEGYNNPLQGVVELFEIQAGRADVKSLRLGCPLNNLVQEMAPLDKGFEKRLRGALNLWIDELDIHLQRAKKKGFIKRNVATRDVATFIVLLHEGFYGLLKGLGDPKVYRSLREALRNYVTTVAA
jgi:AcrR family transcriptional regulator